MRNCITTTSEILSILRTNNILFKKKDDSKIFHFNSLKNARKGDFTFCSLKGDQAIESVLKSEGSLILCRKEFKKKLREGKSNYIFVDNPRLSFIRCMRKLVDFAHPSGIHETAIVKSNKITKSVYIGPHSYIGENVIINENTIIYGNVNIYGNTSIGKNVIIDSCSVIGAPGLGFERLKGGKLEKFPHIGGVKIEDDVEIGANVCIDRGTLQDTIIGRGTKIDNLVHVAHNVKIGKNCLIVANSLLGGSSIMGNNVHVAMSVTIRDGVKIGKNAILGMGAVITKNVPPNVTVIGVPAKPIKNYKD